MKYSDCPTTEVEALIHAPIERVWALVTDITLPSRFSTEQLGCRWVEPAIEARLGARFLGRNSHPAVPREWETTSTVTTFEPMQSFGWDVGDPEDPSSRWRFDVEPTAEGARLRQWMQIGPAPSGLTPAIQARPDREERIIERRLEEHRTNMAATIDGIKKLAEGTPKP